MTRPGPTRPPRATFALARVLILLASAFVPRYRRASWRTEWEAEVWHELHARKRTGLASALAVLTRCLGTFPHALWIRKDHWSVGRSGGSRVTGLLGDVRHAARSLVRSPGFTVTSVGTLALGIAATTAAFGVVRSVILAPLPYPDEHELVAVVLSAPGIDQPVMSTAPFLHFTFVEENRSFQRVGLWRGQSVTVSGQSGARHVPAIVASAEVLPILGVEAGLGRTFTPEDMLPERTPTVVLSHGYWQRDLGEDPSVLGRSLVVDGVPRVVTGVLPPDFRFLDEDVALVLPYQFDRGRVWLGGFGFRSLARLRPGVTLEAAATDVDRMIPIAIASTPPPDGGSREEFADRLGLRQNLRPLKEDVVGGLGGTLWIMLGAISMILVIAAANVANLVLVRGQGRRTERGVRSALGAGAVRIATTQMAEGLIVGLAAALVGVGLAGLGTPLLSSIVPDGLPRASEIGVDRVVAGFGVVLGIGVGALLGIIPLIRFGREAGGTSVVGRARSTTMSRTSRRTLGGLVVVQVALSMVLLIGTGLMARTYQAIADVDPGFDRPEEVQVARISIPEGLADPETALRLQQDVLSRIAAIPGVTDVGYASTAPMEPAANASETLLVEGRDSDGSIPALRRFEFVSPGFFEAIGTDIVAGRPFTFEDVRTGLPVALVSETLARLEWRTPEEALGRRIRSSAEEPWREIVGVVQDIYDEGPHLAPEGTAYFLPAMRDFWGSPTFVWRELAYVARGPAAGAESFRADLQEAIWEVSRDLPIVSFELLSDLEARTLSRHSLVLWLLGGAGAASFVLGIVGLYGILEYAASQRLREFGLRLALGEEPARLRRGIVLRGVVLASLGVVLGVGLASIATGALSSFLFRTSAVDPMTYAVVSLVLIVTSAMASDHPARRATRVSPVIAMRPE